MYFFIHHLKNQILVKKTPNPMEACARKRFPSLNYQIIQLSIFFPPNLNHICSPRTTCSPLTQINWNKLCSKTVVKPICFKNEGFCFFSTIQMLLNLSTSVHCFSNLGKPVKPWQAFATAAEFVLHCLLDRKNPQKRLGFLWVQSSLL